MTDTIENQIISAVAEELTRFYDSASTFKKEHRLSRVKCAADLCSHIQAAQKALARADGAIDPREVLMPISGCIDSLYDALGCATTLGAAVDEYRGDNPNERPISGRVFAEKLQLCVRALTELHRSLERIDDFEKHAKVAARREGTIFLL